MLISHSIPLSKCTATEISRNIESVKKDQKKQWLMDRELFLDIGDVRSDTIQNITDVFRGITMKLVKAGHLMIETKRRMMVFISELGELSYDAKWALMAWIAVMFLFPIITAAIVATIIALFFQTELNNLQIVLHTRWDVGDKPDIITESKAKQRLGNLAMQRLYHKMSRHPERFLPKRSKRNPEALIYEKLELPQASQQKTVENGGTYGDGD